MVVKHIAYFTAFAKTQQMTLNRSDTDCIGYASFGTKCIYVFSPEMREKKDFSRVCIYLFYLTIFC